MSVSVVCDRCGHANREAARFCARCGRSVEPGPPLPSAGTAEASSHEDTSDATASIAPPARDPHHEAALLEGYRSLGRHARWMQAVFIALIVGSVVAIGSDGAEVALTDRVIAGELVSDAQIKANDSRQAVVGLVVIVLWVAAAIVFIRWFHAAYRNLRAFGFGLRFKPGWSIGAWFVPILNLWRPKQIANDIWRASAEVPRHVDAWSRPVPALLGLWWAAWIAALFVSRGAFRSSVSASTPEELRTSTIVDIVGLVIEVAAAVLAILFVRRATARQDARVAQLRATSRSIPAPEATE